MVRKRRASEPDLFTYKPTVPVAMEREPSFSEVETRDGMPVYTVSGLTAEIKQLLETAHGSIYLRGEVSGFRSIAGSGHWYFDLKDDRDLINAACFKGANRKLGFAVEDGMEVVAFGRVSLYRSRCQIIVEHMEPAGAGVLQLRIEQLKKKLEAEGLFDESRKREIPFAPRSIAVVTSAEGAAVRDFLKVTRRRFPGQHITIFPCLVQGDAAPAQIVEAIRDANGMGGFDVLVTCRGGGSLEDLMAFNDEAVCRAIAASEIPVINAVGHEPDVTIADFVADLRAATPSQAAELVTPAKTEIRRELKDLRTSMERSLRGVVEDMARDLDDATSMLHEAVAASIENMKTVIEKLGVRVRAASPVAVLARQRQLVEQLSARIGTAATRRMEVLRQRMASLAGRLDALSPLSVLGRGYAIAFALPARTVVKDASSVAPGDELEIRVAQGSIRAAARAIMKDPV